MEPNNANHHQRPAPEQDQLSPQPYHRPVPSMDERAELALRITAAMQQFWVANDAADEFRVIEVETWLDTLGACTVDEFRTAWVQYQREGARSERGTLHKPDPGLIWRMINGARVQRLRAQPPVLAVIQEQPPVRETVTDEQRAEILKKAFGRAYDPDAGFLNVPIAPKRFPAAPITPASHLKMSEGDEP